MNSILTVQSLEKTFTLHNLGSKVVTAFDDVSFELPEGKIIGISGASGAGKSSLFKCIYRTYLPTHGSIIFNSKQYGFVDLCSIDNQSVLQLRKSEITYCSQFLSVIPRVSALQIVTEKLISVSDMDLKEASEFVKDIFVKVNLPQELWSSYPATFSGGEQQRVNIARAIVTKPRLLLLDEPTSSLDYKTKHIVIDMFNELKNQGTSILCISHDKDTLDTLSDSIYTLEKSYASVM